jgi:Family of unknown function (DUF5994)
MTRATKTRTPRTPDDAVRLRMDPVSSRATALDGAWWPRTTDVVVELPALVTALASLRGEITHVLLSSAEWDEPHPRRITVGGRGVRLGWFTSQPAGLITVMTDFGRDRFDLLVVPPDASPAGAETVLAAAADGADNRRTPELLAAVGPIG